MHSLKCVKSSDVLLIMIKHMYSTTNTATSHHDTHLNDKARLNVSIISLRKLATMFEQQKQRSLHFKLEAVHKFCDNFDLSLEKPLDKSLFPAIFAPLQTLFLFLSPSLASAESKKRETRLVKICHQTNNKKMKVWFKERTYYTYFRVKKS